MHRFTPKLIPTRWVGEQHVREDLGRIPTMNEWFDRIPLEAWMNRSRKLSKELELENVCGSCGQGTQHIEGRCRNCGGPFAPRRAA